MRLLTHSPFDMLRVRHSINAERPRGRTFAAWGRSWAQPPGPEKALAFPDKEDLGRMRRGSQTYRANTHLYLSFPSLAQAQFLCEVSVGEAKHLGPLGIIGRRRVAAIGILVKQMIVALRFH